MLISRGTDADIFLLLKDLPMTPFTAHVAQPEDTGKKFTSQPQEIGTFTPAADAQRLLFMMSLSVTLVGMFAAAYTIVTEKSLYLRERMVNLKITSYIASKVIVYGGLAIISCLLFLIVLSFGIQLPTHGLLMWGPLEIFITLALTALAGVSIGLLLSALNNQFNAVTYGVLAILFVQILFAGVLFKMDGPLDPISRLTITRWSLEAMGGTVNMDARNAEGRIKINTVVINTATGQPLENENAKNGVQIVPAPPSLSVNYPSSALALIGRWIGLLAFSVIFIVGAGFALTRNESF
jgi:hypothetical protein